MIISKGKSKVIAVFILGVTTSLISCTGIEHKQSNEIIGKDLVWPSSPAKSRIRYIGKIELPEDLGIRDGFLALLKEAALGKEDKGMVLPIALVVNKYNQLFVADPGKNAVHRYDQKAGKYTLIGIRGNQNFASPVGLAVDDEGNAYVADSELAKVFVIHYESDEAEPLSLDENFVRPTGLVIDKTTGWIYVVDTGSHCIFVFRSDNSLVKKIGRRGTGDGEFNYPTFIWQDGNGRLLVTDSMNFRIQILDRYGGYIEKFGRPGNASGDMARPKGVAEDSKGHVYVVDSLFHNVQIFSESGTFMLGFGEQGQDPGQFWLPVGVTITGDDTIYVADSYNKRVQLFKYIGE